jgi:broad specificity phosphatase PhoE
MRRNAIVLLFALVLTPALLRAQQTTVILVRHAERTSMSEDALSAAGKARAQRLAELLRHAGIRAIYSTAYKRTRETAQPLAQALGIALTITQATGATLAPSLSQQILRENRGNTVLVVGHSNTTPDVIRALGAPAVPAIPDSEYDNLYVVQIDAPGKATLIRAKF